MPLPLSRLLENHRPAVLVVGDVMCDVYLWGKVTRISPEAPVPIFESMEQRQVLGGAGNVAANLRALGCEVYLVGVVGTDSAAQRVRAASMRHAEVDEGVQQRLELAALGLDRIGGRDLGGQLA